jgi:hypothetical protein
MREGNLHPHIKARDCHHITIEILHIHHRTEMRRMKLYITTRPRPLFTFARPRLHVRLALVRCAVVCLCGRTRSRQSWTYGRHCVTRSTSTTSFGSGSPL